jgi:predicted RNA-binding Zn ribbon-like protein
VTFSHDTEHALGAVVELINSGPAAGGVELLGDVDALAAYVDRHAISGVGRLTQADVTAVHRLRTRFHRVFQAADDLTAAVRVINDIMGTVRTSPHLTDHDGHSWHVHYHRPDASISEHLAAECGMALTFVVAAGELDRLRTCDAPGCSHVLVDLSRNRCRRYCDSRTCGNRIHVAAYRARRRTPAPAAS